MARRQGNGLDISGVGKQHVKLSGGDMKSRSGLQMASPDRHGGHSDRQARRAPSRKRGNYIGNGGPQSSRVPRKTLAVLLAVLVGAVLLAVGVGCLVYQQTVKNALKPEINSDSLTKVLVQPNESDEATWSVLVKTDASSAEAGRGQIQNLALVYADANNKTLSFLWIPTDARVYLDGYGYKTVGEGFSLLGESGLVTSVAKLADVKISHYLEVNDAGLARFEDDLAPLEVEEKNASREQTVAAISKKICGSSSEQMPTLAGYLTTCFATDMDDATAASLFKSLQGLDVSNDLYQVNAPMESQTQNGDSSEELDSDAWNSMVARVRTGLAPVASKKELGQYEAMRSNSTVDIWNGVGVSGIASDCSSELKKHGWKIGKTGNAAQFVYKETLVVYNDSNDKKLAELVVSDLGQGRVVRGAARYNFTGDVLVVLGSDYRPY